MNRERAEELLPIMQAYVDGKEVQYFSVSDNWVTTYTPKFYSSSKYRIKPEPRVLWVYPMGPDEFEATTIKKNTKNFAGVFKAIEVLEDE